MTSQFILGLAVACRCCISNVPCMRKVSLQMSLVLAYLIRGSISSRVFIGKKRFYTHETKKSKDIVTSGMFVKK